MYATVKKNEKSNDTDAEKNIKGLLKADITEKARESFISDILRRNSVTRKMQDENRANNPETVIHHVHSIGTLFAEAKGDEKNTNEVIRKSHILQSVPKDKHKEMHREERRLKREALKNAQPVN